MVITFLGVVNNNIVHLSLNRNTRQGGIIFEDWNS